MEMFSIQITETLARLMQIEADNVDDAIETVEKQWRDGKIVLSSDDFIDVYVNDVNNI